MKFISESQQRYFTTKCDASEELITLIKGNYKMECLSCEEANAFNKRVELFMKKPSINK